jgi:Icc protein
VSEPAPSVRIAQRGRVLRIAQVTDTHLEQQHGGRLLGMDTDASLVHVLDLVRAGAPDVVLATGDLANHGTDEAYARVRGHFESLGVPWFWLPGNHDDPGAMMRGLGAGVPMARSVVAGDWQLVLLDSTVPGQVGGRLGAGELALLDALLERREAPHALVCLHHQPVPIGCAWLDEQRVEDGHAFLAVLARHPCVRAVVWGHVHQEFDEHRGAIRLLASPSTCIQFARHSEGFRVDESAPGMRWLELAPDGGVDTRVERVSGVHFEFDRDSTGYL